MGLKHYLLRITSSPWQLVILPNTSPDHPVSKTSTVALISSAFKDVQCTAMMLSILDNN